GVVNADAQLQGRKLKAIVSSARLLGLCFLGFGLLVMMTTVGRIRRDPIFAIIGSSLTSSGVLYIVFGVFLRRRRYWAWVAMLVMTILMLIGVGLFTVFVILNVA